MSKLQKLFNFFDKKHLAETLQQNPQLRSVEVSSRCDTKTTKDLSKYLQNVHSLYFGFLHNNL